MRIDHKLFLWGCVAITSFLGSCSEASPGEEVPAPLPAPTPYQLDLPQRFGGIQAIPADNPLTQEGVALGRTLFYEKALSANNTMSCGSCHQQQFAFTDGQAVSKGVDGIAGTRSAMSLANLLWVSQLNWDGGPKSLEEQAKIPLESPIELHQNLDVAVAKLQATEKYPALFEKAFGRGPITKENLLKALAQFTRTLISSNSRFDRYQEGKENLTVDELLGMRLFLTHPDPNISLRGGNCGDCHGGTLQTFNTFHNNGLDAEPKDAGRWLITGKESDRGKFRAPSLRNIALTAPYMHDGRFKTLEDVLNHYNEHVNMQDPNLDPLIEEARNDFGGATLGLTGEEKRQIIAFLHTLTDETFIKDPRFSDPNK
ncbi:cytochrome-c peroxidase [Rufibacter psychrotolerans]|uniref:cytochrome-c peroxidase n=1 Tax=Rufibacter psychrotolerans TaxID=2812556 RepID=UPI0019672756|nr:cytochrome c peroxidase [Rufibacter sp. SYSU D00308]